MTYAEYINELNDDSSIIRKYYKDASDIIGVDRSYSRLNIGFCPCGEPRVMSLEINDYYENYESDLEQANAIAKKILNGDMVHLVMGINECDSDFSQKRASFIADTFGFRDVCFLPNSCAAAIGAYWNYKTTTEKTVAVCVFRGNSFGDSTSFGISIIDIKNGIFNVRNMSGKEYDIDNHVVKEICLNTIRELDLKQIDEVLIVGKSYYVTYEKPLIKAVRRAFRRLFGEICYYVRGDEKLVAKGLAVYGNMLRQGKSIIVDIRNDTK